MRYNFFSNCLILDLYSLSFNREVLQHNYSKMEQINSYSAEFVIDYVAISRSYDDNVEGIYCVNIRGTSKTKDIKDLSNDDTPTNHEWNAVFVENHWIFIDCTWDCQNHYYGSGYIYNDFVNTYFDVSEKKMSLDHKIKIVDYRNFFDAINYFNTR